jgi:hypothetical protein
VILAALSFGWPDLDIDHLGHILGDCLVSEACTPKNPLATLASTSVSNTGIGATLHPARIAFPPNVALPALVPPH